ncbi:MAG: hypothetical protein ABSG86_18735 [Thermoguttaceae bacterium]|jgi:hypothetical protein
MSKARYALALVAALVVGSVLTLTVTAFGQRRVPAGAPNVQCTPLVDQRGKQVGVEITGAKGTVWYFGGDPAGSAGIPAQAAAAPH